MWGRWPVRRRQRRRGNLAVDQLSPSELQPADPGPVESAVEAELHGLAGSDIGVAIIRITDELPSAADLDRVQRRLEAIGWPADPNTLDPNS